MVLLVFAKKLMPSLRHYAPMEAAALRRYKIFTKVGIFPVDIGTPRGASQFLRMGEAVLNDGGVLWVTPQGKFVDTRVRPLVFKPGLAALAARAAPCTVLPLAIEYLHWDERQPECLLHFGEPVSIVAGETADHVEARLLSGLTAAMDTLRELAVRRTSAEFELLLAGRSGTGGFYALGQRIRALFRGERYRPDHTSMSDASPEYRESRNDA